MSDQNNNFLFGIDIGTTKICAIIGEAQPDGQIEVRGVGLAPSHGLRKGIVVDIKKTARSIGMAVKKAEQMAGLAIESAFVGVAGAHISSLNSRGVVATSRDHIITLADKERAIEAAKAVVIPQDKEIVHVIPREFIIDGQGGVTDPVGMAALRLEAEVHIITGAITSIQNIIQCVNQAGIEVDDIVLEPIASSKATVSEEEKEGGIALIDIGGGTTDIALFLKGAIWHTFVLPLGGNHITHDIAIGLKIPILQAEQIKKDYGCALIDLPDELEYFEIKTPGQRSKPYLRRRLAEIIEARAKEILSLVKQEIVRTGQYELLAGGIVLTGGVSQLEGLPELASQIFDLPVRIGLPTNSITGLVDLINHPLYSTAVGLLIYAQENQEKREPLYRQTLSLLKEILDRAKKWWFKKI